MRHHHNSKFQNFIAICHPRIFQFLRLFSDPFRTEPDSQAWDFPPHSSLAQ
jgi:hypothetical protein